MLRPPRVAGAAETFPVPYYIIPPLFPIAGR